MPSDIRLKEFQVKASPTPDDIIYMGNTADDFNEVRATISALISAYPILQTLASLTLEDGQLIIGSTAAPSVPIAANLTAGTGISIINSAGGITISASGGGVIAWTEVTGTTQTIVIDNGYVANNAATVVFTLPATAAFGTVFKVIGKGAGGWRIDQNAGQNLQVGSVSSTVGVGGSVASTNRFDSVNFVCTEADTTWTTDGAPQGILTIV